MDAKITVTTRCNARCKTCPVWKTPKVDMRLKDFAKLREMLDRSRLITRILLNNTGDLYNHPDHVGILLEAEKTKKQLIMTTNGQKMDYVPKLDVLIISFNGGTKEAYERTTGLPFEETVENIKSRYPQIKKKVKHAEIHCLICELNKGTEKDLLKIWEDFPGNVRVSYKYDNQMQEDLTLKEYKRADRIPCDYLTILNVLPDGRVISCAHDFWGETNFGNVFRWKTIDDEFFNLERLKMIEKHKKGIYDGLCTKCNYNTPLDGKILYLK